MTASFEYAAPETEADAVGLLSERGGRTAVYAGGTDVMTLLRGGLIAPERVVDIRRIGSMQGVRQAPDGISIGTLTTLKQLKASPFADAYESLRHVVDAIPAIQVQSSGTVGGDLCLLPNCWYFRNGYGLLGMENGESLVAAGDNRYHAILGNHGPAKFVSASRLAPALIAWGAHVRIVGPAPDQAELIPLEYFFLTPKSANQGVTVLKPGQLISHLWLPAAKAEQVSGTFEALQLRGLDWPLAAASATLSVVNGVVTQAKIVMGHVAPTPWVSEEAASVLRGQPVTEELAQLAGDAAVARATPLSCNDYKVQIARTAVKRAVLRAVRQLPEGV